MTTLKRTAGLLAAAIAAAAIMASPAEARWRHHHGWHGGGAGGAIGFATGALIGSALAPRPYYYSGGPYYAYSPAPVVGSDDAYCSQRFKSYDPASGTYLGYDGNRHPCP